MTRVTGKAVTTRKKPGSSRRNTQTLSVNGACKRTAEGCLDLTLRARFAHIELSFEGIIDFRKIKMRKGIGPIRINVRNAQN
jgi:hypothetical protein